MRIPKAGEFYRHFKDKLYQIITVAEHSEDGQKLVIYQALYGDFKVYARPLEMFVSEVDHEKYPQTTQKYRFERVELEVDKKNGSTSQSLKENVKNVEDIVSAQTTGSDVPVEQEVQSSAMESITKNSCEEQGAEEGCPDPGLLAFLDEDSWDMKYNILVSLRDKMTDKLVDDLAVVMDVVIPEGPLDKRYEQLKICVRTRQKYENQHLR